MNKLGIVQVSVVTLTGGIDSECHAIFPRSTDSSIDSHTPHGYPGCAWSVCGVILKSSYGAVHVSYVLKFLFGSGIFRCDKTTIKILVRPRTTG